MEIQPQFPPHRRQDPRRRAEAVVYDQLARSGHPGQALYELKATPEAPELDFAVWFEDLVRIGLQVKGGRYSVDAAVWTLQTARGVEQVPCPLTQTWDAAIAVRDAVDRVLGFKVFIIPVLLLSDTPPNPLIKEWAGQRRVKVLFGADDLVGRLLGLAERTGIKHPPAADHILNEVDAVTNGLVVPAGVGPTPEPVPDAAQELMARPVVIYHVDTVNMYVTQACAEGLDPQVLPIA